MTLNKKFLFFAHLSVLFVFSKMIGFAAGGGKDYVSQSPKGTYLQPCMRNVDDGDETVLTKSYKSKTDLSEDDEAIHEQFLQKFQNCLTVIKGPAAKETKMFVVDSFISEMEQFLHELSAQDLFRYLDILSFETQEQKDYFVDALGRRVSFVILDENKKAYEKLFDYLVSVKERNNI